MIKTVVFDLDDTLFPERDFVLSGFRAVSNWLESNLRTGGFFDIAKRLFAEGGRGNIFDCALARLGVKPNPPLIHVMLKVYRQHFPDISLFADAAWILAYLKHKKQLAIITDGYLITQQNKIAALGIGPSFQAVVYADEFGRDNWKPSSIPYLKVMEILNCAGKECIYVGDNPAKDFIAAKKLGWRTIHICRTGGEYSGSCFDKENEADYKISSLHELGKFA